MTTKVIGINEYRTKLTRLWKESQKKNIRYIVVVHNKPVFEVNPIFDNIIDFAPELREAQPKEISVELQKELDDAVNMPKSELYNI